MYEPAWLKSVRKGTSDEPNQPNAHTASDQSGFIWMVQLSQVQMTFSYLSAHPNAIFCQCLTQVFVKKKRVDDTLPAGGRGQGAPSCLRNLDRRLLPDWTHPAPTSHHPPRWQCLKLCRACLKHPVQGIPLFSGFRISPSP